ncbi:MAG: hypothetical protein U0836_20035 [Pirellulales bacterium]
MNSAALGIVVRLGQTHEHRLVRQSAGHFFEKLPTAADHRPVEQQIAAAAEEREFRGDDQPTAGVGRPFHGLDNAGRVAFEIANGSG